MLKIKITGLLPAVDGDYQLDESYFTNRELHLIKRETGVRAGELEEAFEAKDNDLLVVLAEVALARNGKTVPLDVLWDAKGGQITIEAVQQEADTDPPGEARKSEPASPTSDDGSNGSSGKPSSTGGDDHPETTP